MAAKNTDTNVKDLWWYSLAANNTVLNVVKEL